MSEPPSRLRAQAKTGATEPPGSLARWEGGIVAVGDLVRLPMTEPEYRLVLWVESQTERVVGARFVRVEELEGAAGELLRYAVQHPLTGTPGRPAEVLVQEASLGAELRPQVGPLGIRVTVVEECTSWKAVVKEFGAFLAAHWPGRSYLGGANVTTECLEQFFHAAAAFYRQAPWRVMDETPIELQIAARAQPLYAVVLGGRRMVHGLTLYLSGDTVPRRDDGDAHPMRAQDTVAVTFDREDGIPPPMLEERRAHRWPLAGPAAFPLPYRQLADGAMREPDADDLDLLTIALHAVAEFAARHPTALKEGRRTVEAVQLHGTSGDSIARLTFPAQLPDPTPDDARPTADE